MIWLLLACIAVVATVAGCIGYLAWWYAGRVDALRQIEEGRRQPMLNGEADPWPKGEKRRER